MSFVLFYTLFIVLSWVLFYVIISRWFYDDYKEFKSDDVPAALFMSFSASLFWPLSLLGFVIWRLYKRYKGRTIFSSMAKFTNKRIIKTED